MLSFLRTVPRRSRVRGRNATAAASAPDGGFSLIEVVVAMMLFALVAVMVSTTLVVINRTTDTASVRQTAMNLAQTQVDLARTTTDFAKLTDTAAPIVKTVSGRAFSITQHVAWLGANDGDVGQCTAGSGASIGKTIKVTVTWAAMGLAKPVELDSIVSPDSRLGSQSTGAIVAAVRGANGQPMTGLTVSAVPNAVPNGAASVPGGAVATDAGGCAYLANVTPGNYDVSVKGTGTNTYIDNTQVYLPVQKGLAVSVASSTTVSFQYDQVGAFQAVLAAQPGITATSPLLPGSFNLSFVNTYGVFLPPAVSQSGTTVNLKAHPYSAGYTVIGGDLGGLANRSPVTLPPATSTSQCLDVDPTQWPASADGTLVPPPAAPAVAAVAGSATAAVANVTMGALNLQKTTSGISTVTIKTAPTVVEADDPGCASGSSYTVSLSDKNLHTVLLPFGSWTVVKATGLTASLPAGSPAQNATRTDASGNFTVTLDPRVAP